MFNTSSSAYAGTVEIVLDENKQKALKTTVFRALISTQILFKFIFVSGSSKIAMPYNVKFIIKSVNDLDAKLFNELTTLLS